MLIKLVSSSSNNSKYFQEGFSLLELLIALGIVIILVVISVSLYTSQVRKSRRADAMNTLAQISLAEERYRSSNTSYGTLAQVWGGVSTTANGYYTIAISSVSSTGYTLSATAQGTQASDTENATACNVLQLIVSGGTVTKSPSTCWPE